MASLAVRVAADCECSGVDYTNGGAYYVDVSSNNEFQFTSEFNGKPSTFGDQRANRVRADSIFRLRCRQHCSHPDFPSWHSIRLLGYL